jgi:hypothetical protein
MAHEALDERSEALPLRARTNHNLNIPEKVRNVRFRGVETRSGVPSRIGGGKLV